MNVSTHLRQNLLGKGLNHLLLFLINVSIVRILGAQKSGFFFNEIYIINLIVLIGSFGLDIGATRWISKNNSYFNSIQSIFFKSVIVFPVGLLVFYFFLAPVFQFQLILPFSTMLLFGLGNLLISLYQGLLMGLKRYSILNLILIITNLIFLFFLYCLNRLKPEALLFWVGFSYSILLTLQGVLCLIISQRYKPLQPIEVHKKKFIVYSSTALLSSAVYYCFLKADNFFVAKYYDSVSLSNYVQCGKIGQYFIYFSSAVNAVLIPALSTGGKNIIKKWMKFILPYMIVMVFAALILLFFGNYLYVFLFGKSFSMMYSLMLFFLPGFFCLGVLTLLNAVFIARGKIIKMLIGDLIGLLLLIILDIFLVPNFGIQTAALCSSICYASVMFYLMFEIKKQFKNTNRSINGENVHNK